jgi:hypothetical protein
MDMPLIATSQGQIYGPLIIIFVVVLALILRNRRPRTLRIELLWVRPVILLGLVGLGAIGQPTLLTPLDLVVICVAVGVGAALGWQRGRLTRIEVDPETHAVRSHVSVLGIVFIVGVLLLRMIAVGAMHGDRSQLPFSPILAADALVVLVVAMFAAQGLEMWIRARRLLAQARTAKPLSS